MKKITDTCAEVLRVAGTSYGVSLENLHKNGEGDTLALFLVEEIKDVCRHIDGKSAFIEARDAINSAVLQLGTVLEALTVHIEGKR
jgi:hypothetical protein